MDRVMKYFVQKIYDRRKELGKKGKKNIISKSPPPNELQIGKWSYSLGESELYSDVSPIKLAMGYK